MPEMNILASGVIISETAQMPEMNILASGVVIVSFQCIHLLKSKIKFI